ncbi:MAG: HD domain-containing protein [Steroidobacteraceae bacterium]
MNGIALVLKAAAFSAHEHREHRRKDKQRTPYINHPLAVAEALCVEGRVHDPEILAAALLHDTLEDTETTYDELHREFGSRIAVLVAEVSDDKSLHKAKRKRLQVDRAGSLSSAAQQIEIADKLCTVRDILARPPSRWSAKRKRAYFEWAKEIVDQVRTANAEIAAKFDAAYAAWRDTN